MPNYRAGLTYKGPGGKLTPHRRLRAPARFIARGCGMSKILARRRSVAVTLVSLLLVAVLVGLGTAGMAVLAGERGPTVTTDELDYAPEATVQISGSNFAANAEVTVRVTRPDLSTVTGDGSFDPWPTSYDTIVADGEGDFQYNYILDGILGEYLVDVLDGRWDDPLIGQAPVLASVTFWDSRNINSVTLNGGSSVTVAPGASITASVNVTTKSSDNDWKSTSWRIATSSGPYTACVDHTDHTSSGTYTESFSITAPATLGIYNAYFVAYSNDTCSSGASSTKTLSNSVVVQVPNPELAASCGTDIALVIDGSGSITESQYDQMQAAFVSFVQAFLPETPTQFALVEFAGLAVVRLNFTGTETTITTEINESREQPGTEYTNWQQGLTKAHDLFPNRVDKPDLIIFASDGNPNRIGNDQSASESAAVAAAVTVANDIKSDGTRIITIGIGDGLDTANLIAISSADAMYTSGFDTLAAELAELASELCGGTISVHKIIDADGNPSTTNDQSNGQGWHFDAPVTGGSASPPHGDTAIDGFIVFDIGIDGTTASVNITETVKAGFSFISAVCTKNGDPPVGTPATNAVNGIVIGPQDIVSCTFYNTLITHTLTMAVSPSGGGTTTPAVGPHTYDKDTVVAISATPASGYRFDSWTGDADCSDNSVTMSADRSCTANFVKTYTLTMAVSPSGGGTTNPAVGPHTYDKDAVVAISATPASGYRFGSWTGDADCSDNSVTMSADKSCTANFVKTYTLTMAVSPSGGGTTTPAVGPHTYDKDAVVAQTATPASGYRFDSWSGDADCSDNSVTMSADRSCTANFSQIGPVQYTLTMAVSPSGGGTTTPAVGAHPYDQGTTVALTATPASGYRFDSWSGPDATDCSDGSVTMSADKSCTANFALPSGQFVVHKDFIPNSAASVSVSLNCTSGSVSPASASASEGTPATFTVTGFTGNPNCTATESPVPPGYTSSGSCSATLTAGSCTITNTLESASVGGIVEVLRDTSAPAAQQPGSAAPPYAALAGATAAGALAFTAVSWYARRRWLR